MSSLYFYLWNHHFAALRGSLSQVPRHSMVGDRHRSPCRQGNYKEVSLRLSSIHLQREDRLLAHTTRRDAVTGAATEVATVSVPHRGVPVPSRQRKHEHGSRDHDSLAYACLKLPKHAPDQRIRGLYRFPQRPHRWLSVANILAGSQGFAIVNNGGA